MTRMDFLLAKTALDLKNGMDPLNGAFLADNDVTSNEGDRDAIYMAVNYFSHLGIEVLTD